jgi:hypothetical protein
MQWMINLYWTFYHRYDMTITFNKHDYFTVHQLFCWRADVWHFRPIWFNRWLRIIFSRIITMLFDVRQSKKIDNRLCPENCHEHNQRISRLELCISAQSNSACFCRTMQFAVGCLNAHISTTHFHLHRLYDVHPFDIFAESIDTRTIHLSE